MISTSQIQGPRYSAGYPEQIVSWSAIRSRRWARAMSRQPMAIYSTASTPVARAFTTPESRTVCAEVRWKRFMSSHALLELFQP